MLVHHLRRGLAVLVHHPRDAVPDLAQVQTALVRLAPARAAQLCAPAEGEGELAGAPAVAFELCLS